MSLPVFSELLQGQEGIKSIYTLHFQASIHDKQNLGAGAGRVYVLFLSLVLFYVIRPACHPQVSL